MNGVVYAAFGAHCDSRPGRAGCSASPPPANQGALGRPHDRRWRGHLAVGRRPDVRRPGHDPVQHRQRRRALHAGARQLAAGQPRRVDRAPARAGRRLAEGRSTSSPPSTRQLDKYDADFASGGVTGLPRRSTSARPRCPTWRSRSASRATSTCSTATRSAASSRAPAAQTRSCSASARAAACGRARGSGRATAATSTSPPSVGYSGGGSLRRLQVRPVGHRPAVALAGGELHRRLRLGQRRAGDHLRRHDVRHRRWCG